MSGKPVYVLGTGLSHDGSACLLKDGRIAVAIEKERITRHKHDGGNDDAAITYCLSVEGILLDDVELVVQNANFSMFERGNDWFQGSRLVGRHPRVVTLSHHLAHAYSAIATAPYKDAAVLVIDGCGNAYDESLDRAGAGYGPAGESGVDHLYFEKDSYYRFTDDLLTPVFKDYSPWGYGLRNYPMCPRTTKDSIGGLYQAASVYCFGGWDDSGKLMGLAPYGRPGVFTDEIFSLHDGRVFVNYDWMVDFDRPRRDATQFQTDFQYYADIACWVQREVERALLYVVNHRYQLYPSRCLAYAGGVALNAVANSRILRESPFQQLYIQPAAGDNGLAIGCAYYGWVSVLGGERHVHDGSSNFGRVYPDNEIAAAFACREAQVDYAKVPDVVEQTAALLAEGRIVGWFQGGSEFGPRALGNRSILADPRREGVKDFINARIKRREDFRPFAPAILERCVVEYFDWDVPSPYMVLVAPAKPNRRDELSSVIHRDGSGRLQTVTPASNARFHALLESFARRTGLPVLLNTSFNRRGMPIVESPAQAIAFFLESELDVLVIGDFVGYRRPLSSELAPDLEERMHRLEQVLRRHPVEAGVVGGLCELVIRGTRAWTMNLSPDSLAVSAGKSGRPDVSLELSEADFWRLADDPFEIAAQLVAEDRLIITGSKSHAAVLMWMLQRALHAGQ